MIPGGRPQKWLLAKTVEPRRQQEAGREGEEPRRWQEIYVYKVSVLLWVSSLEIAIKEHPSFIDLRRHCFLSLAS